MSDFDPLAILGALERNRVSYVIIGDLAGVLRGTDLAASTIEITPSLKSENVERLDRALEEVGVSARRRSNMRADLAGASSFSFSTVRGGLLITPVPPGTGGYDDLRRAAQREPLGHGIRAPVASAPDLVRSLAAVGGDTLAERRLRRLVDLGRSLSMDL